MMIHKSSKLDTDVELIRGISSIDTCRCQSTTCKATGGLSSGIGGGLVHERLAGRLKQSEPSAKSLR